eukprot:TRINITY_DN51658_c0_g2_i1.p1 TRINITY_DN51658_c0_g2~~TRINITY_DN51658_c0_g2_i1.p1  ORF type:complete len:386 (+),score=87.61 TRINITY_DN51658_c0_g2_i1:83-1240(+)
MLAASSWVAAGQAGSSSSSSSCQGRGGRACEGALPRSYAAPRCASAGLCTAAASGGGRAVALSAIICGGGAVLCKFYRRRLSKVRPLLRRRQRRSAMAAADAAERDVTFLRKDGAIAAVKPSAAGPTAAAGVVAVPADWRRPCGMPLDNGDIPRQEPITWDRTCDDTPPFFQYHSLATLFPEEPALAEIFNTNAKFRTELRQAARRDMLETQEQQDAAADALDKSVQAWLGSFVGEGRFQLAEMANMTEVFERYGLKLSGRLFASRLMGLCNGVATGSWTDIVGYPQRVQFWHQDEGKSTYVVMLGFPPEDNFVGEGVFSQVARISHKLCLNGFGIPVEVDFDVPEQCIFRPVYAPGQEVVVYNDAVLLHKAPDAAHRESIWRIM